jgi:hypothetical protein
MIQLEHKSDEGQAVPFGYRFCGRDADLPESEPEKPDAPDAFLST